MSVKEFAQQSRRLLGHHTCDHFRPVWQPRIAHGIEEGTDGTGLRIKGSKNHSRDPRSNNGSGAHGAWFQGDDEGAITETPAVTGFRSTTDGQHLRVGRRVAGALPFVAGFGKDFAVSAENHRADGNVTPRGGAARHVKGLGHGLTPTRHRTGHRSARRSVSGPLELRPEMNPGSNVGQDLVRVLVSVSESLHVKLPQPSISKHVAVTHGLGIVIGIRNVLTEEISDIAGYRPIVGLGGVGQKDLHISATHPDDDVKLVIDGHHTDSPSITGQTPQLGDELIEVISEHRFHRNCDALTVIVVEGYYKVDLILAGVLEIVVIVIIVVIVVPVIAVVVVIRQLVVIVEIIVVIDVIVGDELVIVEPGHDDLLGGGERLHRCRHFVGETVARPIYPPHSQEAPRSPTRPHCPFLPILKAHSPDGEPNATNAPPCAKVGLVELNVMDHPLVSHKLTLLRSVDTPSPVFRQLVEELVTLMAYEGTREVRIEPTTVTTPLTATEGVALTRPKPLVVPILRAGLGMLEGMMRLIPSAEVGFVGMARDEETLQPMTYAERLPKDLSGRQCYVLDPMLATGGSLGGTVEFLVRRGADHITCLCILAAPEGIENFRKLVRDLDVPCHLIVAGLDDHLDEHGYIVPGLGDAGDRLYGLAE